MKYNPIKIRADDEQIEDLNPSPSLLEQIASISKEKEETERIKSIVKVDKKTEEAFRVLIDEKITTVKESNPRTKYFLKLIEKKIKKIRGKIEKMNKMVNVDEYESVNIEMLKTRFDDFLIVDLENYIEKLRSP